MKILSIGPIWRGSNAGGLFRAFTRKGVIVDIVDENYYISLSTITKVTKIFERLIRGLQIEEFNKAIIHQINYFQPDILFVYKGRFVTKSTLSYAKEHKCKLALFFPDVSLTNHGKNIPECLPMYDIIFTTKTFGVNDLKLKFNVNETIFIPHGFDPDIHRKIDLKSVETSKYNCDVSFIGTWSPKKEKLLTEIKSKLGNIDLKIWGGQWNKVQSEILTDSIQNTKVTGDLYAIAIQCSKINLGILSEQVVGASSGDLITSRTFHIPACFGFMLHEENVESTIYFKENEEAAFFTDTNDLIIKIEKYLQNPALREHIRESGYRRALAEHSLDHRATEIINKLK